jgi:hypothetical protein
VIGLHRARARLSPSYLDLCNGARCQCRWITGMRGDESEDRAPNKSAEASSQLCGRPIGRRAVQTSYDLVSSLSLGDHERIWQHRTVVISFHHITCGEWNVVEHDYNKSAVGQPQHIPKEDSPRSIGRVLYYSINCPSRHSHRNTSDRVLDVMPHASCHE